MSRIPLAWLRQVRQVLVHQSRIPILGRIPSFPWSAFSQMVATAWKLPTLAIVPSEVQFLSSDETMHGLGASPRFVAVELFSLQGQACLLLSQETVRILVSELGGFSQSIYSESLIEGFFLYIQLQILEKLNSLELFRGMQVVCSSRPWQPSEDLMVSIDLEIRTPNQSHVARFICSHELHDSYKKHFASFAPHLGAVPITPSLDITASLSIGHVGLTVGEWKGIKVGDLIILDSCSYDLEQRLGTAVLSVDEVPLWHVKLGAGGIQMADRATYVQEKKFMDSSQDGANKPQGSSGFLSGLKLSLGSLPFNASSGGQSPQAQAAQPVAPPAGEAAVAPAAVPAAPASATIAQSPLPETAEGAHPTPPAMQATLDAPLIASAVVAQPEGGLVAPASTPAEPTAIQPPEPPNESLAGLNGVPFTIVIEAGRLSMKLEKLLQLEAGNLLELAVTPESGVDLVVNGTPIAKGELVKIGDLLGVKVVKVIG